MKLSIFTTMTTPQARGDNFKDALACYRDLADEVVVVDGSADKAHISDVKLANKHVYSKWPTEFDWQLIGEQFQKGYGACTGDWVIRCDLDYIFHEKDFERIREAIRQNPYAAGLSFLKWQFIQPDRYNLKSRLVVAVNKGEYGNRIKFDSGGDLCQPSLDGREIDKYDAPQCWVPIYTYEKILKNERQIKDDATRMARAWQRHFNTDTLGDSNTAYTKWMDMMKGRLTRHHNTIPLSRHPKYIQETIKKLTPEQFGYSGFGELGENSYV